MPARARSRIRAGRVARGCGDDVELCVAQVLAEYAKIDLLIVDRQDAWTLIAHRWTSVSCLCCLSLSGVGVPCLSLSPLFMDGEAGKGRNEARAGGRAVLRPDLARMGSGDLAANRQPETRTAGAGG